jgi:hypothetical protein
MTEIRVVGLVVIVSLVSFNVAFLALGRLFSYPDILRRPASEILERYRSGGRPLQAAWYAFMAGGLLFTLVPLLLHPILESRGAQPVMLATGLGLLAGLVQVLGLLRWSFLVPYLADEHARAASEADRRVAEIVFESSHRYLGTGVGEHLGYLLTGLWIVAIAFLLPQAGLVAPILGWIGLLPAAGILCGLLEPVGVSWAGAVNAVGYLAFSIWLIAVGIALLVG